MRSPDPAETRSGADDTANPTRRPPGPGRPLPPFQRPERPFQANRAPSRSVGTPDAQLNLLPAPENLSPAQPCRGGRKRHSQREITLKMSHSSVSAHFDGPGRGVVGGRRSFCPPPGRGDLLSPNLALIRRRVGILLLWSSGVRRQGYRRSNSAARIPPLQFGGKDTAAPVRRLGNRPS